MAQIIDTPSAKYADPINGTSKVLELGDGVLLTEKIISDPVNVRPGRYYVLSCDFLIDADDPGESHYMTLRTFDSSGIFLEELNTENGKLFIEPEDLDSVEWTRLSTKFLIPENAYKASVVIAVQGQGIIQIDGVQLQRGEVATAFNPHVTEEFSEEDLARITNPDLDPPGAPTLLQATAGFKNIILAFTAPADGDVAYYEIYRALSNSRVASSLVGTTQGTVWADSGLTTGVTYYYWVRAVDTGGNTGEFNAGISEGVSAATIPLSQADFAELSILNAFIADATIDNAKIANVSASKLTAGTITAGSIHLGSDRITLSGASTEIRIRDELGTTRVLLGRLGEGIYNYGLQVRDQTGKLILGADGLGVQVVGQNQLQDGSVVSDHITANAINVDKLAASSVIAEKIASNAIETRHLTVGSVTADRINVTDLSAISASLGVVTAGVLQADGVLAETNYWNLSTGEFSISTPNGSSFIRLNPETNTLEFQGTANFTADWNNLSNRPSSLSEIDPDAAIHLDSITPGADVTSENTSANTSFVGAYPAVDVAAWALDPASQINNNTTTINGGKITTGSITALQMNVASLSAISADIGEVTAGVLKSQNNEKNYLNLNAAGTEKFINVNDKFWVNANGEFSATAGQISGNLLVAGSVTAENIQDAYPKNFAPTCTYEVTNARPGARLMVAIVAIRSYMLLESYIENNPIQGNVGRHRMKLGTYLALKHTTGFGSTTKNITARPAPDPAVLVSSLSGYPYGYGWCVAGQVTHDIALAAGYNKIEVLVGYTDGFTVHAPGTFAVLQHDGFCLEWSK